MASQHKKRGKDAKSRKPASVLTKVKVASAFVGVVTAFLAWYFPHCYDERKEAISEIRDAFAERRAAQDRMVTTEAAAVEGTYRFVQYLKNAEAIKPQVVRDQVSQLALLYQEGDAACEKDTQATNRYEDAEDTLSQVFSIAAHTVHKVDDKICSSWKDNVLRLTFV